MPLFVDVFDGGNHPLLVRAKHGIQGPAPLSPCRINTKEKHQGGGSIGNLHARGRERERREKERGRETETGGERERESDALILGGFYSEICCWLGHSNYCYLYSENVFGHSKRVLTRLIRFTR